MGPTAYRRAAEAIAVLLTQSEREAGYRQAVASLTAEPGFDSRRLSREVAKAIASKPLGFYPEDAANIARRSKP